MPYPENMQTALEIEQLIKDQGAVPATIAILDGVIHIGLTTHQISSLAQKGHECVKCTRRNLAYVMTKGLYGSTTVAATMYLAHKAGIKFFVTGGIGGVHRGAEETWDVSADLTELGRTPVTVISAGIKSILDIPRTLEYLETQGVPVIGYQTDFLPTFYSPISDYPVMCRLNSPQEIAEYVRNQELLGLNNGMLVGVPLAPEDAAHDVEQAIQVALGELKEKKIAGAGVTPYVLKRVAELSKGESLRASKRYIDIALIKNNARIGSQIALAYYNTKKLVVVGASMYDVHGVCAVSQFPSGEAPGFVYYRPGGVGRNIAEAARRYHQDVTILTVVGNDPQGTQILEQLNAQGVVSYI
jgi:pseudouridine-5'-phosphate glycosidase